MKCEDCLELLEEYTDGEINEQLSRSIAMHISGCMACERAYQELRSEQAMYAGYQREVEVSPRLWAGVQRRIKEESAAGSKQRTVNSEQKAALGFLLGRFREWFSGEANALGFRDAFAVAAAFVVIGAIVSVISYVDWQGRAPSREVVSQNTDRGETQLTLNPSKPAVGDNEDDDVRIKLTGNGEQRNALRQVANESKRSKSILTAKLAARDKHIKSVNPKPRDVSVDRAPAELTTKANQEYEVAYSAIAEAYRVEREQLSTSQTETARHVERAELLLRSFRNADVSSDAFDLADEQQRSRKLLYQNILLRRDATAKGDVPTEELLSSLEPILLDIANLPSNPSTEDVRTVVERMQRKEIVAELQVHSMQTARINHSFIN